jgi:predicted PhzF superfamily epimerase YddE/YHI9
MPHTLHIIDAFTDKPFHGNPAAVCVLESPAEAAPSEYSSLTSTLSPRERKRRTA